MLLCHTGPALSSPVAGSGVSLSSVSILLRVSFVVFFFGLFVCCFRFVGRFPMCLAQDTGLYLCCQFHAQFRFVLARFKFHFFVLWLSILLKFIWYGHHHPRRVLVASNRPPFVLIRPYIFGYGPRCFGLQRRQNYPKSDYERAHPGHWICSDAILRCG